MHTTLVTGGAGFIGSHLVEALLQAGRRVLVIDDLSTGSMRNLEAVQGDPHLHVVVDSITNRKRMADLIDEADDVYHLAAVVGVRLVLREPDRTVAVNVKATESILRLLASRGKPLFMASSSEVYGKNSKVPLGEDDDAVLGPSAKGRWLYAAGKALDDYLALCLHRHNGLPVVIGRFFNVAGPRQVGYYGMVLPNFVDQALANRPLSVYGDGLQMRCFAHVADVVRGMLDLMACPQAVGQVFNIGNDQAVTIRELAERVRQALDPSLSIEHIPYAEAYGAGYEDIRCRVPDLTRIQTTTAYRPHFTLEDIIHDLIAWKRPERVCVRA